MSPRSATSALLVLALGYFALGTASLAAVGLSGPIAADLHVPAAAVGTLVTVFSLVFALAAPVAAIVLGRMDRRRVLLLGLALMTVGGLASAVAPTFATLAAARVAAGLGAAIFGPAASATGSMIVPDGQRARALAVVFGGMTAATVLGVPLAAAAGAAIGWRSTMIAVVALTLLAGGLLASVLPPMPPGPAPTGRASAGGPAPTRRVFAEGPALSGRVFAAVLRAPGVASVIVTTLFVLVGQFTVYGVAGAYLAVRFGAGPGVVSGTLLVFGVFGVAGNAVAARVHGRLGGGRTVAVALAGLTVAFLALAAVPGRPWAGVAVFAFWAVFNTLFMAPQQARLVELLPEQRGVLLALNASALYLGMSVGSLLGSGLLATLGGRWLPALALLPLALAAAAHATSLRPSPPVRPERVREPAATI